MLILVFLLMLVMKMSDVQQFLAIATPYIPWYYQGSKKNGKVWSFAKLGGGVSEGSKKPNLYFGKVFCSEHVESF